MTTKSRYVIQMELKSQFVEELVNTAGGDLADRTELDAILHRSMRAHLVKQPGRLRRSVLGRWWGCWKPRSERKRPERLLNY